MKNLILCALLCLSGCALFAITESKDDHAVFRTEVSADHYDIAVTQIETVPVIYANQALVYSDCLVTKEIDGFKKVASVQTVYNCNRKKAITFNSLPQKVRWCPHLC